MRLLIFVLLLAQSACAQFELADDIRELSRKARREYVEANLLAWLQELEPLQKPHFSYPVPVDNVAPEVLAEFARITGGVSLSGEYATPDHIERAIKAGGGIAVKFAPWRNRFGKHLPPTDTGNSHAAELAFLRHRFEFVKRQIRGRSEVTAVLLDTERFTVKPDDSDWNVALKAKYNLAYDLAKEFFPNATIEWYARGSIQPSSSATGWSESPNFTLTERGDSLSCSLYHGPEIETHRAIFRRTVANADRHGIENVTPWIALASGYRRQTDRLNAFKLDWDYDLIYSWWLGTEINQHWFGKPDKAERFAPWNRAKVVVFYPEPFGRSPDWPLHFVAYCRGANRKSLLPKQAVSRLLGPPVPRLKATPIGNSRLGGLTFLPRQRNRSPRTQSRFFQQVIND